MQFAPSAIYSRLPRVWSMKFSRSHKHADGCQNCPVSCVPGGGLERNIISREAITILRGWGRIYFKRMRMPRRCPFVLVYRSSFINISSRGWDHNVIVVPETSGTRIFADSSFDSAATRRKRVGGWRGNPRPRQCVSRKFRGASRQLEKEENEGHCRVAAALRNWKTVGNLSSAFFLSVPPFFPFLGRSQGKMRLSSPVSR